MGVNPRFSLRRDGHQPGPDRGGSGAGAVVRLGHRLRLRRAALPQVDRCADDHGDGEELRLPVLEALEPELRGAHVLADRTRPSRRAPPAPRCRHALRRRRAARWRPRTARGRAGTTSSRRPSATIPPCRTGQGTSARLSASRGSASCGASPSIGFDSDEPRWNRYAVRTTYMPICRNSDSQFSKVASTKSPGVQVTPQRHGGRTVLELLGVVGADAGQHHPDEEHDEQRQRWRAADRGRGSTSSSLSPCRAGPGPCGP